MTLRGKIKNGKIQLDTSVDWPDGTPVTVTRVTSSKPNRRANTRKKDPALRLSDLGIPMGHTDLAAEHDHHLYGTPRKSNAKKTKRTSSRSR